MNKLSLSLKSPKKKEEVLFHQIRQKNSVNALATAKEQKSSKLRLKDTICVSSQNDGRPT